MLKRMISLVLCLAMVITILPVRVFSVEETAEPAETEAVTPEGSGEIQEESEEAVETLPSKDVEETVPETMPEETEPVTIPEETVPGETVEEILVMEPIEPVDAQSGVMDSGICGAYNTDAITWVLYDSGILEFTGTGNMYETTSTKPWKTYADSITAVVVNEGITSVSKESFSGCTELVSVSLPEGLKFIGDDAFAGCGSLESIVIPEGVTRIGEEAFFGCALLSDITLPDTLETIENYAFWHCSSLASIQLPDSLETLEYGAFSTCESLTHLTIPAGVTYIDAYLVRECPKLEWIEFYNTVVEIDEGVLWNSPSVRRILFHGTPEEWAAIKKHTNFEGQLKENNGVVQYVDLCKKGHTEQTIPAVEATCTKPGWTSGTSCAVCNMPIVEQEMIPAGHIFSGITCTRCGVHGGSCGANLSWLLDERGILSISGSGVMENFEEASDQPWYSVAGEIKYVSVGSAVTTIGKYAFSMCSAMTGITIPDSITSIGSRAFSGCKSLVSVTLPDDLEKIFAFTFSGCTSLKSITIPDRVTTIWDNAFAGSGLTSITIPDSVKEIGNNAFKNCSELKEAVIGKNVSQLGEQAFGYCYDLTKVWFKGNAPSAGANNVFVSDPVKAYYPFGNATWTDSARQCISWNANWEAYCEHIWEEATCTTPSTCTRCGTTQGEPLGHSFSYGTCIHCGLTGGRCGENAVWILDSGTLIISGTGATADYSLKIGGTSSASISSPWFEYRDNIGRIIVEEGITEIGDYGIAGCTSVRVVEIAASVRTIGLNALEFSLNGTVDITFKGNAPAFNNSFWSGLGSHRVIYPDQDPTWTKEVKDSCGSDVYWVGECCRSGHGGTITLEGKAATCTENGLTQGTQCTRCGNEVEKQRTIAAVGHTEVIDPAVDATCDVPGLTEGSHCSTCGEILIPQEMVIKNHNFGMLYGYCLNCGIGKTNCGNGLKWHYDTGTNTLSIFGEGSMNGYSSSMVTGSNAPWTLISNISNLVIKEGVTSIGNYAFYKTSVRNAYLPQGLTSIGTKAFGVSNVVTLEMPASLQSVGGNAFENCGSLKSITFTGNAPQFGSGCFSGTTLTVYYPENDATWTEEVRQSYGGTVTWVCESCRGSHVEIEIPGMDATCTTDGLTDGRKCTVCGDMTVKQDVIPAGHSLRNPICELCGAYGVCGDDLTWSFDEKSGILTITGTGAMYDYEYDTRPWWGSCKKIVKVELPEKITSLGKSAFMLCSNLTSINLPNGLTTISDDAFMDCGNLTDISLPDSLKHIGIYAFEHCRSLVDVIFPEGLETIDMYAFQCCSGLKKVVLPERLTSLGGGAFYLCESLEEVELPETLDTIPWYAFNGCNNLREITIPKSVTQIAYAAFHWCDELNGVTFEGSAPTTDAVAGSGLEPFSGISANAWYPGEDSTWTDEAKAKLGGTLNWIPVGSMDNRLMLNGDPFSGLETVWIDGVEYTVQQDGMNRYIDLPDGNARIMTAYEYHIGDPSDVHTQYPISMKVWTLENDNGVYTTTRQEDFDDILQYAGVSIRVTGKKGIRMITAIDQEKKKGLITDGLAGYTLKEYGTAIAWAGRLSDHDPLVLGKSYVQSNYAYKRDVADSVFRYAEGLIHYTNVLVNFSNEQCKNDIAMRPYMILEDQWGDEVTIYGGIVERSIGYIAYMNRNAFNPDTDAYEYIWDIIHAVYGDAYDEEYAPSWTKPIK